MDFSVIAHRASILYDILEERINDPYQLCPSDYMDGLKAAYALKNKSISSYLRNFARDPYLNIDGVEVSYDDYAESLPAQCGLTRREREILGELITTINKRK